MDAQYAKQILQSLADGVNPTTGEVLAKSDSCNEPDVIRALHWALKELEQTEKPEKPAPKPGHENAGMPWTEEADMELCRMFDNGLSKRELAQHFKRSNGAIDARLIKLGKV